MRTIGQIVLISLLLMQDQDLPPAVASLVEAERAFARTSVERGVRDAFLAFFADDGINFTPRPTRTKQYFAKLTDSVPGRLDWQPILAEVSAGGDLGYTTGPYQRTDPSKPDAVGHGYFFSVWKLQPDGNWKVVLDAGIRTPGPDNQAVAPLFRALPDAGGPAPLKPEAERAALMARERALGRHGSRGDVDDFVRLLDDGARLHRNGSFPVLGKQAIRDYLAVKLLALKWDPVKAEVARSGDLAYTYGSYEMKGSGSPSGYYAHVWRRSSPGDWKIALDTLVEMRPPN